LILVIITKHFEEGVDTL